MLKLSIGTRSRFHAARGVADKGHPMFRPRDILVWLFRCGDISFTTFLYINKWLPLFI